MPVCNGEAATPEAKCSGEGSESAEAAPEVPNGVAFKEPPPLREVDAELLQSGKLKYTGKFDRGRGVEMKPAQGDRAVS